MSSRSVISRQTKIKKFKQPASNAELGYMVYYYGSCTLGKVERRRVIVETRTSLDPPKDAVIR